MPHITIEYSESVRPSQPMHGILLRLHHALAELEAFPMADIKSRAVGQADVCIGDGDLHRSFVHLQLRLLSGRDASVRGRLAQVSMRVLEAEFSEAAKDPLCQMSVEVHEMERSTYIKQRDSQG